MNNAIAFPLRQTNQQARPELNLPPPRIWTPKDLADFLRVSVSWVHRRTSKASTDPPPRCPGLSDLRFDTHSPAFQAWLSRQLGTSVDTETGGDV
jgi:hypothetical protein